MNRSEAPPLAEAGNSLADDAFEFDEGGGGYRLQGLPEVQQQLVEAAQQKRLNAYEASDAAQLNGGQDSLAKVDDGAETHQSNKQKAPPVQRRSVMLTG